MSRHGRARAPSDAYRDAVLDAAPLTAASGLSGRARAAPAFAPCAAILFRGGLSMRRGREPAPADPSRAVPDGSRRIEPRPETQHAPRAWRWPAA